MRKVQVGGTLGCSSGSLENSNVVRDSKQFSCTSSKSLESQLQEVQAHKQEKYRLTELQEVQAHQTQQFNHENLFFLFVENSKKIYILRKAKKYYMRSLILFIRKVHVQLISSSVA
jgi:hypothetical protein